MTYTISTENKQLELDIQKDINECLDNFESFCFDAGAGAGKTYALQKSIEHILKTEGENLKLRNQKILCITYTNAAKDEILSRIGKNSAILASTIHEFLWGFISIQQELLTIEHEKKIKEELNGIEQKIIDNPLFGSVNLVDFHNAISDEEFLKVFYSTPISPAGDFKSMIKGYSEYFSPYLSNVNKFSSLVKNVDKKYKLEETLKEIKNKKSKKIIYNPIRNRDKLENYVISHDTLLLYCRNIITSQNLLKRLFSDRYPYVLVDEYQDTDEKVVDIIDSIRKFTICKKNFVVGFFGDTLQNIYSSGVGKLPNKEEYKSITKIFNRRSSNQIVELIEKIRNDNFGQQSIYTDFDNGSYNFYIADDDFDLDIFLQEKNLVSNTACLLKKNDDIVRVRGFDVLLAIIKKFPRFGGNNFDNVNNEFLQKNLQHMGWFLREILTFIDFIQKSSDYNSTVKEIVQFIGPSKSTITFGEMKQFISSLRGINLSTLTIDECINKIANIQERISGEDILRKIFSIDDTTENILLNIKNRAYDYFYYLQDSEEYSEREMIVIDNFFRLDVTQFIKWYKYIFDDLKNEEISYYTLHGSKGLEFDNVVVVLQDNFAGKRNYCKYFFENYNNLTDSDLQFQEVRNLLYVACSRAKIKLCVIYISDTLEDALKNIESIFGEIQYLA
ncbi:TPA: ATP-dependent helicase [Streptococcus agalactiae]|uniref:UvrD-helicase domain-containing protein n=1 Tax=Streptococcus agalactiae TaxID=1311 RepID=UPI000314C604|nr:UvrD-helicase domain-containing protein [Streptococcus agalactiae]EPW49243.1 helicase [Streptococcus agalactiae LMG 15081]KLK69676.1 helicase [Streptococcus agalactiae]SUN16044.1 uvrD, superfamily I DNA and RNA helicases [Streptococcus agalactiae]SUN36732.1 uvrD, superfamily I DNA and RNA helicases [Streptococcus agalactiae]HEO7878328.1 ATP-dependent helicase [Streptococcus agalactiae]